MASLVVDLVMLTGAFETDIKRAEAAVKKFRKDVNDAAKDIGIGFAVAATASAVLFDQLAKGAAQYADLADMTGASAEALASYAVAAATAGVSIDSVAGAMNKLTKNLVGVDDESKAAGAALKALGLDVAEFKKLDPAAQYEAVSKAMNSFADGAGKAAVAQALWGKSGAEQLKVFKAMEEQGGRTTILTQQMIEQADAYGDAQARATAELLLYAQVAASQMAPAMTDLTTVATDLIKAMLGVDSETGKLAKNNGLIDFAEAAATAMAFAADAVQGLAVVVRRTGEFIGMSAALINASVGPKNAAPIKAILDDYSKSLDTSQFDSMLTRLQDLRANRATKAAGESNAFESGFTGSGALTKPKLGFDGGAAAKKAGAAADAAATKAKAAAEQAHKQAEKYIDDLNKQIEKTQELTAVEQVLADIAAKRVTLSSDQQVKALGLATKLLETNALAARAAEKGAQADENEATAKADIHDLNLSLRTDEEVILAALKERLEVINLIQGKTEQAAAAARLIAQGATKAPDTGFGAEVSPTDEATKRQDEWLKLQLAAIDTARAASAELNAVWDAKEEEVWAEHARKKLEIEEAVNRMRIVSAQNAFGAMAEAVGGFAGEQSAAYKVLFATSKAFAIAESIIAIQTGMAKAWALGWPAGIPAAASVLAATASILSNIQAVSVAGARAGGGPVSGGSAYLVGERGPEMFMPKGNGNIVPNNKLGGGDVIVNLIEDKSKAGRTQEKTNDSGQKELSIFVSDILGDGPRSKAMASAFGLQRRGY